MILGKKQNKDKLKNNFKKTKTRKTIFIVRIISDKNGKVSSRRMTKKRKEKYKDKIMNIMKK